MGNTVTQAQIDAAAMASVKRQYVGPADQWISLDDIRKQKVSMAVLV